MKKNKNLIIVGVIIAIIAVAGYLYAGRDQSSDSLLTSSASDASSLGVDDTLLSSLHQLQKLKLDSSLFSSPVWLSLIDFGKVLSPQAAGRLNPFAPLDSSSSVATTSVAR